MHFERNIYHNQKINKNNMGHVHSKRNVYQSQYSNIGDYDNVYESTQMCAYSDVNWVGNMHDQKSTSSYVFLLGNGVVN
jgi:hypothetical protein